MLELGMLGVITLPVIDVAKRSSGNPMEGFFSVVLRRAKDERARKRMEASRRMVPLQQCGGIYDSRYERPQSGVRNDKLHRGK